jgi:hypothetical protein
MISRAQLLAILAGAGVTAVIGIPARASGYRVVKYPDGVGLADASGTIIHRTHVSTGALAMVAGDKIVTLNAPLRFGTIYQPYPGLKLELADLGNGNFAAQHTYGTASLASGVASQNVPKFGGYAVLGAWNPNKRVEGKNPLTWQTCLEAYGALAAATIGLLALTFGEFIPFVDIVATLSYFAAVYEFTKAWEAIPGACGWGQ